MPLLIVFIDTADKTRGFVLSAFITMKRDICSPVGVSVVSTLGVDLRKASNWLY